MSSWSQELKEFKTCSGVTSTPLRKCNSHIFSKKRKGFCSLLSLLSSLHTSPTLSAWSVWRAVSAFPLLERLSFSLLLLDECSQMTEPASLLPMARYRQSQGWEGEEGESGRGGRKGGWRELGREKGKERGRERGRKEGRKCGRAASLLLMIRYR